MAKKAIIHVVKKYIEYLQKNGIKIESVVIFGSYANNTARNDSDIDILVISKSFGKNRVKEGQDLFKCTRFVDARIEPIPVSKIEYEKGDNPFINEIKKYGIEVTS